jgi:hypothetical protein
MDLAIHYAKYEGDVTLHEPTRYYRSDRPLLASQASASGLWPLGFLVVSAGSAYF